MAFFLHPHHIIDLYCLVDDLLPSELPQKKGGRPTLLSRSELVTILIWNTLVLHQKTLFDLHAHIARYHTQDFPRFPKYTGFVAQCHRNIPLIAYFLSVLLHQKEAVRILDSTMLPVCKLKRADSHKVAKDVANFGKNHQGWHYGFKLHASISLSGSLCAVRITPANIHDAQVLEKIVNKHSTLAVGDSHYGARVMRERIWKNYGTLIISPPHFTQKRKVMTEWQHLLLNIRSKIESVFDYLKNHLHLVSSFPRSVNGYLLHYLRILLGYQMIVGF
jgi:hypothetical protein